MKIKWLGHSCFLITSKAGTKILTDPFDDSVGYEVPSEEADIVTTSHEHYDHNYIKAVKGEFKHIKNSGTFNVMDIKITGIDTYHDDVQGVKRGNNIVYTFDVDGLRICHLGDLGHILSRRQLNELGSIDVLLIPVGGTYTIDYKQAADLVKLINPRVVIPMHFRTLAAKEFPVDSVDKFLNSMGGGSYAYAQEIELAPEDPQPNGRVIVLNYE